MKRFFAGLLMLTMLAVVAPLTAQAQCGNYRHRHGNVSVQQGPPDLTDCGVDICLGEAALATEILEGCCQPVRE